MTIGVIFRDGGAWKKVNAADDDDSNLNECIAETEFHCLKISVDDPMDPNELCTLAQIFESNTTYIRKLNIRADIYFQQVYEKAVELWTDNKILIHELVFEDMRLPGSRNAMSMNIPPLQVLRLHGGNVGIQPIHLSRLETLEMSLLNEEDARSLALALGSGSAIKYLKIKDTYQQRIMGEATNALFCTNLKQSTTLRRMHVMFGGTDHFPFSIRDFCQSIPPTVDFMTICWGPSPNHVADFWDALPFLHEFAAVAPQLKSFHLEFPDTKMFVCPQAVFGALLPIFQAFSNTLKHLSIGPMRKPLKCKQLLQLLTVFVDDDDDNDDNATTSTTNNLETLHLVAPLRLDRACADALLKIIQNHSRLRSFSYHALMGPKDIAKKIDFGLKLNAVHYNDVIKVGKLPLNLWPNVMLMGGRRKNKNHQDHHQASMIFHFLQQRHDELLVQQR